VKGSLQSFLNSVKWNINKMNFQPLNSFLFIISPVFFLLITCDPATQT
jgi:hypothetical protein